MSADSMGDTRAIQDQETTEGPQGAIGAFTSVVRRLDTVAARRAAVRYAVVDRCVAALEVDIDSRVDALSSALVAELGAVLSTAPVPAPDAAESGADTIGRLEGMRSIAEGVRHQHESWDGSGGPRGLAGKDIPLTSRLVAIGSAIADVMTDVTTPINWAEGLERVRELRGSHLDPAIVDAYIGQIDSEHPELDHHSVDLDGCLQLLAAVRPTIAYPIEALSNISAALGAVDDLDDVLALVAEQARRTVGAGLITVARLAAGREEVDVMVNVGDLEPGQERFPNDERHPMALAANAKATLVHRVGNRDDEIGSVIVAPIHIDAKPWGVVIARSDTDRHPLDDSHVQILELVAEELGRAVSKVERLTAVVEMAHRDPLTGVFNRRVLDQRLRDIFDRPVPDRVDAALIMCDLDGLKKINDTQGHAVGDRVLVQLASTLIEAIDGYESTDVCRIGGDEFCVLIERGGLLSSDPIRDRIEQLASRLDDPPISVSCGVATASPDITSASELLRAADLAQYEVKRSRRGTDGPDFGRVAEVEPGADRDDRRTRRES